MEEALTTLLSNRIMFAEVLMPQHPPQVPETSTEKSNPGSPKLEVQ